MSESETIEKLDQTVEVEDAGPACKRLKISIPESRIKDKTEQVYGTLQDDAQLPGFRKGRAPRRLLEKRFADSIGGDVKNQLISESYTQVIEENEYDVIGNPDVKDFDTLELPESGPLELTVEVEITPDVTLPDFGEIKITRPSADVTDEQVAEEVGKARERFGSLDPVEEAVADGDYVACGLVIRAGEDAGDDAEVIIEVPETYALAHGEKMEYKGHVAGILVPDLGKRLIGQKAGEVVTVSMTGPESHENEQIRNAPITLVLTMNRVERVQPAPVEDLFQRMGVQDEEELNLRVRTALEDRAEREQKSNMHGQIGEYLLENVELELPARLTATQAHRMVYRTAMELQYKGVQGADLEQKIAEARSNSTEQATKQLKQFFILDKASRDLEVEVTDQEINGRISMMAMQQNRRPEKYRQEMQKQGQIEQLFLSIREQKTMEAILEKATITDA